MKNSKKCTKCGSEEVIFMSRNSYIFPPFAPWRSFPVLVITCTACGFCEEWLLKKKDLQRAKDIRIKYAEKYKKFLKKYDI